MGPAPSESAPRPTEHPWRIRREEPSSNQPLLRACGEVAVEAPNVPTGGVVPQAATPPVPQIAVVSAALKSAAQPQAARPSAAQVPTTRVWTARFPTARFSTAGWSRIRVSLPAPARPPNLNGAWPRCGRAGIGSRRGRLRRYSPRKIWQPRPPAVVPMRARRMRPSSAARVPPRAAPGDPRRCACPRGPDRHVPSPA